MLLQTLTDRLAEATAEYLHEKVRKEYWGYAKDESLSIPDLYKVEIPRESVRLSVTLLYRINY